MKRFFLFFLSLALSLPMISCGVADGSASQNDAYPEYRDHYYIGPRDGGDCDSLTGNVLITVVFADEPRDAWTETDIADFKNGLNDATAKLIAEANGYGAELHISFHYLRVKTLEAVTYVNFLDWSEKALKSAGFSDPDKAIPQLKEQYKVKEAPILFAIPRGGRAHARTQPTPDGLEYAILFRENSDYRHELLHVFGAKDYYYPKETMELAEKYFPNSIMYGTENPVTDPLTAYLVGWTDTLSYDAKRFLDETKWITANHVNASVSQEVQTGYVTIDNETVQYTGFLLDGMYHGTGKLLWKESGAWYEGSFAYGEATNGTLQWPSGVQYIGEFKNWQLQGQGKYVSENGDVYEGTFVDGVLNGYGTATWANGTRYVGYFQNFTMHGQGTCTFENGQVQSGLWSQGNFIG